MDKTKIMIAGEDVDEVVEQARQRYREGRSMRGLPRIVSLGPGNYRVSCVRDLVYLQFRRTEPGPPVGAPWLIETRVVTLGRLY